jgi:NADH-quinone oxidoreductase subunit J
MEFLLVNGPGLLFYLFATLAVLAAILVVSLRNPMYSAFALLVSFLAVAALFFLLHAEFLAVVQIFVYGGGIMVLFLFVIMLVNLHRIREAEIYGMQWPAALLLAVMLIGLVSWVVARVQFSPANLAPAALVSVDGEAVGNVQAVAWQLFQQYLLPFEIASLFLLVAMIGAVVLARKD